MNNYLVAAIKPWNLNAYYKYVDTLPGNWKLISTKEKLTDELLKDFSPRYIFFPHWSWIVPKKILETYECVCFHMTDVPYGRGGSPLQNLISRGHVETKLSALKMTENIDAGPVYLKKNISLDGNAQRIYERISELIYSIIKVIIENEPEPIDQKGVPVCFARRTPEMSQLPQKESLQNIYDHIRMLDAETYPLAFLDHGEFRLTFNNAKFVNNTLVSANVNIQLREITIKE